MPEPTERLAEILDSMETDMNRLNVLMSEHPELRQATANNAQRSQWGRLIDAFLGLRAIAEKRGNR